MSLILSPFKYSIIALVSFLYSLYALHLVEFVDYGDLLKYSDLYSGLKNFSNPIEIIAYQQSVIGSADLLYSIILRYTFVPFFNFFQFIQIQVFVFVFLLGHLFFSDNKSLAEPMRYLFFICSLLTIYTLGLSTTLIRLALCIIFIFLGEIFYKRKFVRNILYCLALLTHISSFLIILPLYLSICPSRIRPLSLTLPPLRITTRLNVRSMLFVIVAICGFIVLAYGKIIVWLSVILSGVTLKSCISTLFIFILLFPLIANKNLKTSVSLATEKSYSSIFSLIPILLTTLLIGGFRTLILAFFMSMIRLATSRSSFFRSSSIFLSLYPYFVVYSLISGIVYIDKLVNTGFGY